MLPTKSPLQAALALMAREVIAGLKHGFFEFTVSGEKRQNNECRLTFSAGKSHRFNIPDADLAKNPTVIISDPHNQGAPMQPQSPSDQHNPDVTAHGNGHDDTRTGYLGTEV